MAFHVTNDHDTVRGWIESHGGRPAIVRGSTDTLTSLSIVFGRPGGTERTELEEISWDEFFDAFETGDLSFRYSADVTPGDEQLAYNFVARDSIPALDNNDFILPEENEMARENMFSSAPPGEEDGGNPGERV